MANPDGYAVRTTDVTRKGIGPFPKGGQAYGEDGAVATTYKTVLVERANLASNRNLGPDGPDSAVGAVPMVTQASRKTGRIA